MAEKKSLRSKLLGRRGRYAAKDVNFDRDANGNWVVTHQEKYQDNEKWRKVDSQRNKYSRQINIHKASLAKDANLGNKAERLNYTRWFNSKVFGKKPPRGIKIKTPNFKPKTDVDLYLSAAKAEYKLKKPLDEESKQFRSRKTADTSYKQISDAIRYARKKRSDSIYIGGKRVPLTAIREEKREASRQVITRQKILASQKKQLHNFAIIKTRKDEDTFNTCK